MSRQREYGGDRVARYEFLEVQKEVSVAYDRFDDVAKRLERSEDKTNERFDAMMKRLERSEDKANERFDAMIKRLERSEDKTEDKIAKALEASEARLAADRQASEARLANDRHEFMQRFAAERKEWQSTKRWLYLNFGGVIALMITVAIAIIGFIITNGSNQM